MFVTNGESISDCGRVLLREARKENGDSELGLSPEELSGVRVTLSNMLL